MTNAFFKNCLRLSLLVSVYCAVQKPDECDSFFLAIEKEPEFYIPKSAYIVGIESNNVDTFSTFELTAEAAANTDDFGQTGWFSLMSADTQTQFSDTALNTIKEQNSLPKQNIHVLWTAPSARKPNCVIFKATVNYRLKRTTCSQKIEKKFCPLSEENEFSESNAECCACDEAVYSLTFEGLWSNATHPKNFPTSPQLTHYSDFIGCSHSKNITMWAEGLYATESLRQIAEFGSRSIMESELLEKREHLRSLIKMPGLWYPRINQNTSTNFKVDRRHNLISLAAMLGPSPDWFTGISKLNLCTKDCSWVENKVVDLSLYDAGTDSGISYMSPDAPTEPKERVHRITSHYPEDPRAPFYSMEGEMVKPIGKLYIRRNRLIKKSCFGVAFNSKDENKPECATTDYTDWSPCSATCGAGLSVKMRKYLNMALAEAHNCNRKLMQEKICMADFSCPGEPVEEDAILFSVRNCNTTAWSEWSQCTVTCGIGAMTRTRRFLAESAFKKCQHVSLFEKKKCMEPPCKATKVEEENTKCTTTPWTDWSPCTATCGKGSRVRIRHLIVDQPMREFCKETNLEERTECVSTTSCLPITDEVQAKEVCQLPSKKGPCRALIKRWYFDSDVKQCVEFNYGGCRGNRNNFLSWDECVKTCSRLFP